MATTDERIVRFLPHGLGVVRPGCPLPPGTNPVPDASRTNHRNAPRVRVPMTTVALGRSNIPSYHCLRPHRWAWCRRNLFPSPCGFHAQQGHLDVIGFAAFHPPNGPIGGNANGPVKTGLGAKPFRLHMKDAVGRNWQPASHRSVPFSASTLATRAGNDRDNRVARRSSCSDLSRNAIRPTMSDAAPPPARRSFSGPVRWRRPCRSMFIG